MSSSQPPGVKSLDAGWALFLDVPLPDDEDDTRTVQVSSPLFKGPPTFEEGTSDERDTLPPPVPVSEYVQTMMQQAVDDAEPAALPLGSTFSWQGAMPPSSRRGAGNRRTSPSPPARRRNGWSVLPTPMPPSSVDDDDDDAGFTLIAFEPERLGEAAADLEEPLFQQASSTAPGFDDLPFDDVVAASQRAAPGLGFPSPLPPVYPSPRAPSSRGEPPAPAVREASGVSPPPARAAILAAPPTPVDPFDDVRELHDAGDFRSALVMAEALLEADPEHPEARACAASCRETLSKKYLSRLGGLAKILRVSMPPDEIRWLSLDHKAGFILSCIDGTSSIEEVLDVACMQEFEVIRILHDFRELGVIEILPDPRTSRR